MPSVLSALSTVSDISSSTNSNRWQELYSFYYHDVHTLFLPPTAGRSEIGNIKDMKGAMANIFEDLSSRPYTG
jgi:hypothetical protein